MAIFDHAQPITESTFSFPEFVPVWKMTLFHLFIVESNDQTGNTHIWPCLPKTFLISF